MIVVDIETSGIDLSKCGIWQIGALEDAKLAAEAFSRLVYGKNLIKEYVSFPIPEYLI